MEHGAHEQHVVDVGAGPVGIVGDDDVAGLQALGPVLLDRVAHRVGHRAGEEHDAVAHRRRRVVRRRRPGDRAGEVVEVAQDRRERRRQQAAAHVLDDVVEAVGQHGGGEAVAAVALGELRVVEVADHARCSIEISPKRPISATWPGMTKVVERASRITAGPATTAPTGRLSRVVLGGGERLVGEVAQLDRARGRRRRLAGAGAVARDVLDLVGGHDELHAIGDALHRHVGEAVAVAALVGLVEALDQRGHRLGGDRLVAHLDERRLPALAEQAPVEAAARGDAVGGRADARAQRALHLLVAVLDLRRAVGAQHHVGAAALVVDEVGAEQAHRREQAGVRRDHDARDLQQVERGGQEHRAGGAVGHEREVARVDAVAHGDVRDLLGDVGDRDAVGERHALLERERRVERLERAPRELGIQAHLAAGEAGGIEDAHQQAGVGQRRRRAAAPVARGTGVRARALRARRGRRPKARSTRCCRRRRRRSTPRSTAR